MVNDLNNIKKQLEKASKSVDLGEKDLIKYNLNQKSEKEIEKYNKKLKFKDDEKVDEYYKPLIRAITKLIRGYTNLVFIKGKAGVGKTYQIERLLKKHQANFIEYGGSNVSEAYLYRLLYENRGKGEIIFFKDVAMLLKGLKKKTVTKVQHLPRLILQIGATTIVLVAGLTPLY